MRAIFFLTSSKLPSVRSNCWRVFACSNGESQTGFRRARAARAESCPAKIEHRQRDLQPFADRAENIFLWDGHVRNASRAVAVPRIPSFGMRASMISNPGISGVTRNAVIAVLSEPGTGVRAITVSTCAIAALVM